MKFVLIVVAALAVIESINCYVSPTDDSEELMNQINLKILRERLRERAGIEQVRSKIDLVCPGYGSRLENITMEVQSCLLLVDEEQETLCSLAYNHVSRCLSPVTQMFEECLPAQSKKIPSMLQKMFVATTKYICKSDGEHIFELANPCLKNINPRTQRCFRRLTVKLQTYQRRQQYPSTEDFCEVMEGFRPCLQSHLNTACGHHVTKESFLGLFDELLPVCKSFEMNQIEVLEPNAE